MDIPWPDMESRFPPAKLPNLGVTSQVLVVTEREKMGFIFTHILTTADKHSPPLYKHITLVSKYLICTALYIDVNMKKA